MENKKNDEDYNNESYLDKRVKPSDLQNVGVLDEIEDKVEEKFTEPSEKGDEIKPTENISSSKPEDSQKEMHPEIVRKKSKDFTVPLILGAVVLIMVGIVIVYFLIGKEDKPEEVNHQQIIKSAMQEMQKVKTYSYDGVVEFDVKSENLEGFNFDMELSGKDDITNINNIKSFSNFKIAADVNMEGGSQNFSFDLDAVQIGQKRVYLRLNDFDLGTFGMMMGPEVSSLKEKWYKIDIEELEKLSAISTGSTSINMPTYDINKIMMLYNKYELLKFQEDLGDTKVGSTRTEKWVPPISPTTGSKDEDIDVYHYKVKLDGIALANFYVDIMKEMMTEMDPAEKGEILTEEFDEVFKEIEENIKKYDYVINKATDNVDIEIWIGKDDKLIYRTKISGMFDEEFINMIEDEMIARGDAVEKNTISGDGLFKFNIDVSMSDFNQQVEINEPEEAESFMEVLKTVFSNSYGNIEPVDLNKWREKGEDFDNDGLPDEIETIYGTDPNNPDTDGDGYTDGEEIASGYDPLIPGDAKLDYDKLFKTQ